MTRLPITFRLAIHLSILVFFIGILPEAIAQNRPQKVQLLTEKLSELAANTDQDFFAIHLKSIQQVINAADTFSDKEKEILSDMYDSFVSENEASASDFRSYVERKRMLILGWRSPTDSLISFAWLKLPKNWDPETEYPLYIQLHGHWDVAENPLHFMSFTFLEEPMTTTAFEDGYFLSPWARGNQWYHGIAKTDVWESIDELKKIANLDSSRMYLCGHSMGGYGTWHIAQESPETWAAIGIHSGALWFNNAKYLTPEYASKLKYTPTYFVWGDQEAFLKQGNLKAYDLLDKAGNINILTTEFIGGHDYHEKDVEEMYEWLRQFRKD